MVVGTNLYPLETIHLYIENYTTKHKASMVYYRKIDKMFHAS